MRYLDLDTLTGPADSTSMTMIHASFKGDGTCPGATTLLEQLYQAKLLDGFAVTFRPPFTACSCSMNGIVKLPKTLCVTFELRSLAPTEALKNLWAFLQKYGIKVTWKNNTTGYEVGENAAILDSWELCDDMG
jgi:hypothetical protein